MLELLNHRITKEKAKVSVFMKIIDIMKVPGTRINVMAKDTNGLAMEIYTKAIMSMEKFKVKVCINGKMAMYMMVSGMKVRNMVMVCGRMLLEIDTLDNGNLIWLMDTGSMSGKMETVMRENGGTA